MTLPAGVLYELHNIAVERANKEKETHKISGEHFEDDMSGG